MHLDAQRAVALAALAAPALHVEREAARAVAAHARLGHRGEERADAVEDAGVGGGVACAACGRSAPDRRRPPCRALERRVSGRTRRARPRRDASCSASARWRVSFTSVDLPEPETPVTTVKRRAEARSVTSCRLCSRQPASSSRAAPSGGRRSGAPMRLRPREVGARQRVRVGHRSPRACPRRRSRRRGCPRPGPCRSPSRRARIVSSSCSTTITLLPASRRRTRLASRRSLSRGMEPDRRLVEDVEHAHQARADLRREPDALALAARERARSGGRASGSRARRRQEAQPVADLFEDAVRDRALRSRRARAEESRARVAAIGAPQTSGIVSPPRRTLRASGRSARRRTRRTAPRACSARAPRPRRRRAAKRRSSSPSTPSNLRLTLRRPRLPCERELAFARAVEHELLRARSASSRHGVSSATPRCAATPRAAARSSAARALRPTARSRRRARVPGRARAFADRARWPCRGPPQARQAPCGLLNENVARRDLGVGDAAVRAGVRLREQGLIRAARRLPTSTVHTPPPRRSAVSIDSAMRARADSRTTIRSTTTSIVCTFVFASAISSARSRSAPSMRARTKPCSAELGELLLVLAFLLAHDRREQGRRAPSPSASTRDRHLLDRLARDRLRTAVQCGDADAREEQAQVVEISVVVPTVERGLRLTVRCSIAIAGERPSIDSTSGSPSDRETGAHRPRAIPRSGAGPRRRACRRRARISRAREARDHDQAVARDVDVDVAQVVLARAADRDHARLAAHEHGRGERGARVRCQWFGSARPRLAARFARGLTSFGLGPLRAPRSGALAAQDPGVSAASNSSMLATVPFRSMYVCERISSMNFPYSPCSRSE